MCPFSYLIMARANPVQIGYSCKATSMLFETHTSHLHISATHYRLALRSACSSQPRSPSGRTVRPGTHLQISSSSSRTTEEPTTSKRDTITACHRFSCQLQSFKLQTRSSRRSITVAQVLIKNPHRGGLNSTTRLSYTTRRGPQRFKGYLTVWR